METPLNIQHSTYEVYTVNDEKRRKEIVICRYVQCASKIEVNKNSIIQGNEDNARSII